MRAFCPRFRFCYAQQNVYPANEWEDKAFTDKGSLKQRAQLSEATAVFYGRVDVMHWVVRPVNFLTGNSLYLIGRLHLPENSHSREL